MAASASTPKKKVAQPVQKKMSSFLLDSFIVDSIKKKDRAKMKDEKEAKEAKEIKE